MRGVRVESFEEQKAREIVAAHLGVRVERFDDGRHAGMVDGVICAAGGDYPLEVITDHEVPYQKQAVALERYGETLEVAGIRGSWHVTIHRSARVDRLHRQLPALLQQHDATLPEMSDREQVPEAFRALGIRRLSRMRARPDGWNVYLSQGGWTGSAGMDDLGAWVTGVLVTQSDVAHKLDRHGGAQRHAFIWATAGTYFGAQSALMERDRTPRASPELPDGITHAWVAGLISSHGCLHWDPELGWTRTAWSWPAHEGS